MTEREKRDREGEERESGRREREREKRESGEREREWEEREEEREREEKRSKEEKAVNLWHSRQYHCARAVAPVRTSMLLCVRAQTAISVS